MGLPHQVAASPRLLGIPCWLLPVFAGSTWLLTLTTLLLTWISKGSPHYPEMQPDQNLAYISDTGTSEWGKPLFITGSAITVTLFAITFIAERYLRHRGDLLHDSCKWNTVYSAFAGFFSLWGAFGLMMLTIFDARRHIAVHFPMIGVFVIGYLLAATFMAVEKKRIAAKFPHNTLIRRSYQIKIFFIILELIFAGLFSVTALNGKKLGTRNASVILEWVLGYGFVFYMWSFAVDFLPVPRDSSGELLKGASGMIPMEEADSVELVRDPEKLWDVEMAVRRPEEAASSRSQRNRRSTRSERTPRSTRSSRIMMKVEHFQDSPKGTGQYVRIR